MLDKVNKVTINQHSKNIELATSFSGKKISNFQTSIYEIIAIFFILRIIS